MAGVRKVCGKMPVCSNDMPSTIALPPSSKESKSMLRAVKGMENKFSKTSRSGKELGQVMAFGISGFAALASHLVHHPLYTLKSHMMMHGSKFKGQLFMENIRVNPVRFLYRGKLMYSVK